MQPVETWLELGLPGDFEVDQIFVVFNIPRTPVVIGSQFDPGVAVPRDAGELLRGGGEDIASHASDVHSAPGAVIHARHEGAPDIEAGRDKPTHPNVLGLEILDRQRWIGELSRVRVLSIGQKPELVRVVLKGGGGLRVADKGPKACLDTINLQYVPTDASLEDLVPGPEEYKAQLEAALNAAEPGIRDSCRFFAELDRTTMDILDAEGAVLNAVELVFLHVSKRFTDRLAEHASNPGDYTPFPVLPDYKEVYQDLAEHFIQLAKSHLGPEKRPRRRSKKPVRTRRTAVEKVGIDLKRFEGAFEDFADGRLRLQLQPSGMWSTQPSSGFYFFFAEMALLFAEANLDEPFETPLWEALANVMVRTQESFCARYGPKQELESDRDTSSYGACQYREEEELESPSGERRAALREKFKSKRELKDLSIAAAENAAKMMARGIA